MIEIQNHISFSTRIASNVGILLLDQSELSEVIVIFR